MGGSNLKRCAAHPRLCSHDGALATSDSDSESCLQWVCPYLFAEGTAKLSIWGGPQKIEPEWAFAILRVLLELI